MNLTLSTCSNRKGPFFSEAFATKLEAVQNHHCCFSGSNKVQQHNLFPKDRGVLRKIIWTGFLRVHWWGDGTWEALESDSVPWDCSTWRVKDFDLVWWAGTHDHSLGHHSSHLGWLHVTKQNDHAVLHLQKKQKVKCIFTVHMPKTIENML